MQRKLGFIKTSVKNIGHGLKASINSGLNKRLLVCRRAMKNEVGNLLRKTKTTRVANAEPQSPEVCRTKVLGDTTNAVVPAVTTTFFQTNVAWCNIELIVHNQNGICWNFVELHKGINRTSRVVHVGGWLAAKNG